MSGVDRKNKKRKPRRRQRKTKTRQAIYCTHNVLLKLVRATTVAVKKTISFYIFWVYVCRLRYPSCNVHAPYCYLSLSGCTILPILSHKRQDFRINVTEHEMCVLIFSTIFVRNVSHSKENWAGYEHKCIIVFMENTRYYCQILTLRRIMSYIYIYIYIWSTHSWCF